MTENIFYNSSNTNSMQLSRTEILQLKLFSLSLQNYFEHNSFTWSLTFLIKLKGKRKCTSPRISVIAIDCLMHVPRNLFNYKRTSGVQTCINKTQCSGVISKSVRHDTHPLKYSNVNASECSRHFAVNFQFSLRAWNMIGSNISSDLNIKPCWTFFESCRCLGTR